jgi:hypothetical protein
MPRLYKGEWAHVLIACGTKRWNDRQRMCLGVEYILGLGQQRRRAEEKIEILERLC